MSLLLVIDIDGTISNAEDRIRRAGPEPTRDNKVLYDYWVSRVNRDMEKDAAVPGMVDLLRYTACRAIYLTSREEQHRNVTQTWLQYNSFPEFPLIMRDMGDYREGVDFKESKIRGALALSGCDTVVLIDDDEHGKLEEMCKRNGYTFLKARSGGQK